MGKNQPAKGKNKARKNQAAVTYRSNNHTKKKEVPSKGVKSTRFKTKNGEVKPYNSNKSCKSQTNEKKSAAIQTDLGEAIHLKSETARNYHSN